MPGPHGPWGDALVEAVRDGRVPEAAIDAKVRRILRLAARVGALEGVPPAVASPPEAPEAEPLLREASAAGMVLVRNEDAALPLDRGARTRVALLGPNVATARTQGGGSATVHPDHVVSPLDGLRDALGDGVELVHAVGARIRHGLEPVRLDQVRDPVSGEPGVRVRYLGADGGVVQEEQRFTGKLGWLGEPILREVATIEVEALLRASEPGTYAVGAAGVGRFRVEADGAVLVDEDVPPEPGSDPFSAFLDPPQRSGEVELGPDRDVRVLVRHEIEPGPMLASLTLGVAPPVRGEDEELAHAVELAASADVAIVVVGTTEAIESEGFDRRDLALPGAQDELVRRVAAANPRTVVVVNAGAPVLLPWRDEVAAVLLTWFGGQEFGAALADVLLGDVGARRAAADDVAGARGGRSHPVDAAGRRPARVHARACTSATARGPAPARRPRYPVRPRARLHDVGLHERPRRGAADHGRARAREHRAAQHRPARRPRGRPGVSVAPRVGRRRGPRSGSPASRSSRPTGGKETHCALEIPARAFAHWDRDGGWQIEGGAFELLIGPSAVEPPAASLGRCSGVFAIRTRTPDPPDSRPPRNADHVQSLERGLSVIRAFDAEHRELGLSEVARATGLTRAAARRFLLTLVALGYMHFDGSRFSLRPRVLELGFAYLSSLSLPELAEPHMEALVAQINESSSISVLDDTDVVYVARVPTRRIMSITIAVGTRLPAFATSMGRVLLAALPDAELEERLARVDVRPLTPRTVKSHAALRRSSTRSAGRATR